MYRIHIVLCVIVVKTLQVSCQCGTDINNIPEAKAVNEILTGILWNISVNAQANWTFEATQINAVDITSQDKKYVEEYFSVQKLTSSSSDTYLVFNITKPLDKESPFWINVSKGELNMIHFKIECISPPSPSIPKTIFLTISPVNEFAQKFNVSVPKTIQVTENSTIGKTVFNIFPYIIDEDIPKPGMTDYSYTIESDHTHKQIDGSPWFYIPITSSDSVVIKQSPDFDQLHKQNINTLSLLIVVKANDESGFKVNTTLNVEIIDVDDLPPAFDYPGCNSNCSMTPYEAYTGISYRGNLQIHPTSIRAKDQDTLNATIVYNIIPTPNSYHASFKIDQNTAVITQIGNVLKTDIITIEAKEDTANGFFQTATLLVRLSNDSAYLPQQSVSSDDSGNLKLIAIIVGALSLIIIGILVFLVVFVYKRTKKKMLVNPDQPHISPETSVEDLVSDRPATIDEKINNWKQSIDPTQWPTVVGRRQQLDPLSVRDESTCTETEVSSIKKKRPRKKKKRLMEIFDGTKKFEGKADPEFFTNPDKTKIKRSTKSKKIRTDFGPLVVKSD